MSNTKDKMYVANRIAHTVRNSIEDMHCEGKALTDDNMPEFNNAVRCAIYEYLSLIDAMVDPSNPKQMRRSLHNIIHNFLAPPVYRDDEVLKQQDKETKAFLRKLKREKPLL